jgi:hypothetical protein
MGRFSVAINIANNDDLPLVRLRSSPFALCEDARTCGCSERQLLYLRFSFIHSREEPPVLPRR